MNNKGQLTVEYMLLLCIILIILITITPIIMDENEQNQILNAAQIGAQNGVDKNAYAIYYNDTYNEYYQKDLSLLKSNQIKIIKITLKKTTNKTIKIYTKAHTTTLTSNERYIASSRINYYIRYNIMKTFQIKTNDTYYNPAYSNNYRIETQQIEWV